MEGTASRCSSRRIALMNEKRKERKHKKHATVGEPYLVTGAVTHIRLVEVNPGKLAALDALAPVYLALCQQYITLFCTQERPNKVRDPLYATPLSERCQRVAIMQAAGIPQSWRTNRAAAYQRYHDHLPHHPKRPLEGTREASPKAPRWHE